AFWRHTAAIRPDEVFDSIHRIAIAKKAVDDESLRQNAQNLLVALGMDRQTLEAAAQKSLAAQQSVASCADTAKKAVQSLSDKATTANTLTIWKRPTSKAM